MRNVFDFEIETQKELISALRSESKKNMEEVTETPNYSVSETEFAPSRVLHFEDVENDGPSRLRKRYKKWFFSATPTTQCFFETLVTLPKQIN